MDLMSVPGDSGQNEVERANTYIRDTIFDGAPPEWQHYGVLNDLDNVEIDPLLYDELHL